MIIKNIKKLLYSTLGIGIIASLVYLNYYGLYNYGKILLEWIIGMTTATFIISYFLKNKELDK